MAKKKTDEKPEKKKRGRPPKDPSEKVVRLVVYVQPDVAAKIDELAARDGDPSASSWASRALARLARADA